MRCKDVLKLLLAYQDGRLTQKEQEEVQGHLPTCSSCQEVGRRHLEIWDMLNMLEPVKPSSNFKAQFWQRVRQEELKEQNWWTGLIDSWKQWGVTARPAFAFTSVLAVSILGTLIALKVLPEIASEGNKSPILQWAQSTSKGFIGGGF